MTTPTTSPQSSPTPSDSPQPGSPLSGTEKSPTRKMRAASTHPPQLGKKTVPNADQESYESILWRIDAKCQSNETMAVGFSGCSKKSGTTTVAANLALHASAQQQGRVLLIDANWQGPGLQKTWGVAQKPGLYEILSGDLSPRECDPQPLSEALDLLCRGKWDQAQPASVQQDLVEEMLADFKTEYSLILVDLPSAEGLRSALPVARKLDGVLLVTRFEKVKQLQAQRIFQHLQEDSIEVWGSILNRHRDYVPKWLQNFF